MPEFNKRVVVEGMPKAEADYSELIGERLLAEREQKQLNGELEQLRRMSAELRRQAERGR